MAAPGPTRATTGEFTSWDRSTRAGRSPSIYLLLLDGAEKEAALAVGERRFLHGILGPTGTTIRADTGFQTASPRTARGVAQKIYVIGIAAPAAERRG